MAPGWRRSSTARRGSPAKGARTRGRRASSPAARGGASSPPGRGEGRMEPPAARLVRDALAQHDGDVLVFLPGAGEIRRVEEMLSADGVPPGVRVLPLFGSMAQEAQDEAIRPSPPGRRKVVLATSIA